MNRTSSFTGNSRSVYLVLTVVAMLALMLPGTLLGSTAPVSGAGNSWYVNGALGTDDGSHGTGPGADAFKTIQYALNSSASGDTINIAAQYASGDLYEEQLTISKSISLVGEVVGYDKTNVENCCGGDGPTVNITNPGLDVHLSNILIGGYNRTRSAIRASGDTLTLDNVEFFGDTRSSGDGGGMYAEDCTLTLNGCSIDGDAGGNLGGGIYADNCTLTLNGCVCFGEAGSGGAIYALDSAVALTDCYFVECEAGGDGAGVYLLASDLTARRCTFVDGVADNSGGAIYIGGEGADEGCTVNVGNCTFVENGAEGDGGGAIAVYSNDAAHALTFTCCTLVENWADSYGGGLYLYSEATGAGSITATLSNCIFDNSADEEGPEIYLEEGGDYTVSSDYNLYYDMTPDITIGPHDITGTYPMCYYPADNGGLTPTCAIDSASPARGHGSAAMATDQRGVARGPANDIGAYQWVGPTYANAATGSDTNNGLSAATPKEHVYAAANLAGPGSTAYVAAGTYSEENHLDIYEDDFVNIDIYKPLTLTGAGAASTIIDGSVPVYEDYDDTIIDVYYGVTDVSDDAAVTISGLTLRNNGGVECYGGALHVESSGVTTVRDCIMIGNNADYGGGGIYIEDAGTVVLLNCAVSSNTASEMSNGGGIYIQESENVTLSGCTISGNRAMNSSGGGIYNEDGNMYLTNCTIYGNGTDEYDGGGAWNSGHMEYLNCTIANNSAGAGSTGGGHYEEGTTTAVFKNTILAGNTADGSPDDIAGDGEVTSNGHNICSTAASSYFDDPTDRNSTNPNLGPLQDNGGPTFTCAITSSSPAFNGAADGPPTDQRGAGYPRPALGGYDVGAFELQTASPSPTVISVNPNSGQRGQTLTVVITGTNFIGATSVEFTDNITTITGPFTVLGPTQISVTLNIPADASLGAYDVLVTTPEGQGVGTGRFTVTSAANAPTVTSVNPDSGRCGDTLTVSVTGTGFTGATIVSFGPGITVTFTVVSPTQINAIISIEPNATLGIRYVSVTAASGTSTGVGAFTVLSSHHTTIGTGGSGSTGNSGGVPTQGLPGIVPTALPSIVVHSAALSTSRVTPGEPVTVSVNMVNQGTVNGTTQVKVYVNGEEEVAQGVVLMGGASKSISFTVSRSVPGTYSIYVGGTPAGSFTVEQQVDSNLILVISCALILSGLALSVVYVIRRRQSHY